MQETVLSHLKLANCKRSYRNGYSPYMWLESFLSARARCMTWRSVATILVPRAPVSFGHVVSETDGTNNTSSSGDENALRQELRAQ